MSTSKNNLFVFLERNVRTETTENYEKATETLKELENAKNQIFIDKNIILKGIQTAMERRNEIEEQKDNSLEKLTASFTEIVNNLKEFFQK